MIYYQQHEDWENRGLAATCEMYPPYWVSSKEGTFQNGGSPF